MKKYKIIITIEDHSIIGGLSDIIKSKSFENKFQGKLILNSLKDEFKHVYSSQKDLLEAHGISSEIIIKKIKNLI